MFLNLLLPEASDPSTVHGLASCLALCFYLYFTSKVSSISIIRQLGNIASYALLCAISLIPSILLHWVNISPLAKFIVGPASAAVIYIILLELLRDDAYQEFKSLIKNKMKRQSAV